MLTYRLAQIEDIPHMAEIEQLCFDYPHNQQQLRTMLGAGYWVWVAESEAKGLCGYIIARAVLDEADLLQIAVAPDKQRQGIAQTLYQQLQQSLKTQGVQQLFLEVRRSNTPAIALYQRLGFAEIAVRKGYYSTLVGLREDALIFKLAW